MPTFLDFDSTSSFRNYVLNKTLQQPNGPQTFTSTSYPVSSFNVLPNVDPGDVETGLGDRLLQSQNSNTFKPLEYFVKDMLTTIPRRANLELYPYFTSGNHTLFGIFNTKDYDNESEMFKFAANNISTNKEGPVLARIQQNLIKATYGRVRVLDALNGNTSTAVNLVTGREQLIEKNYNITVAKTLPGKAIDFLQTVAGVEFPWSEIPGDYLTNPYNPINYRPTKETQLGAIWQDVTGALGSLFGIQRRPTLTRKPSDLLIEYMGSGQKQSLYNNLTISRYRPDYTSSGMSQESSKLFNFIDKVGDAVTSVFGEEAPSGNVYVGDDRGNNVKHTMGDFNDNTVRSSYYLSLMFDPIQTKLFQRERNISEGGKIGSPLTWYSKSSQNKLGIYNEEYTSEQGAYEDSLSTNFTFRNGSLLNKTQEILNTMPRGGDGKTHVGNIIDQTSRVFRDGDTPISRGSAIKYVDKFTGEETGIEYCRVWTKDRSYMNYSDTMKRTGNIRKFKSSVMENPWNLNIGPMSNGNGSFDTSTNIFKHSNGGFYAKKYMFSIENLAWKTSNTPGFTVQDLPYCERGNNDGRVMWFPPYDLKITEQNSAKWESNVFLGRPEPIYTYQNAERNGTVSFKVVVDHPSILNLLVKDHFKDMSSEESENYINAFFAGCEELDFYELIRRYTTLDASDIQNILDYLNKNGDPKEITKYKTVFEDNMVKTPNTGENPSIIEEKMDVDLYFLNDYPKIGSGGSITSDVTYKTSYDHYLNTKSEYIDLLNRGLDSIFTTNTTNNINDRNVLFGKTEFLTTPEIDEAKTSAVNQINVGFNKLTETYVIFDNKLTQLKNDIKDNKISEITIKLESTTSFSASEGYNFLLSIRRSNSVVQEIFDKLSNGTKPTIKWSDENFKTNNVDNFYSNDTYNFKDFGFDNDGTLTIQTVNKGEISTQVIDDKTFNCNTQVLYNTDLSSHSPVTFYCRNTSVSFGYKTKTEQPKEVTDDKPQIGVLKPDGTWPLPKVRKPQTDVMQRIVMKTLSECHYFKVLEEDSPLVFSSLKEKLRYFHPGFHSTTPEGLNSRLTFLLQCLRPGETIPIKGVSDENDLTARNTSFGPPPICVLRIGDFYHSKVIIRDVNITYDDSTWDLNPEGIGVQPMIANVALQISFIGGHGMEKPVERLQNALSSNFYANTEMYDERSIKTNTLIDGIDSGEFTKTFLETLQDKISSVDVNGANSTKSNNEVSNGVFIGLGSNELDYTPLINEVYELTNDYFETFKDIESKIVSKYGLKIGWLLLSGEYRKINTLTIQTSNSTTNDINLLGMYPKGVELSTLVNKFMNYLTTEIETRNDISSIIGLGDTLSSEKLTISNELIRSDLVEMIEEKLNSLINDSNIKTLEEKQIKLINVIDKVNFITKYGHDGKIDGTNYKSATLNGFTEIYTQYSDVITYIDSNHIELVNKLDNSFNFNDPNFDFNLLSEFLSVLLSVENKNDLINLYKNDTVNFNDRLINKIDRKISKFLVTPDNIKIKTDKFKGRKKNTEIKHIIDLPLVDITDTTEKDELTKIFSSKVPLNSKLNFYKP